MTTVWQGAEALRPFLVPLEELEPYPNNPRRGDVNAIAVSLRRFGQVKASVTVEGRRLVTGHHVVEAARAEGWTHVAAIPAEFASDDDARAFLIADNRTSELGRPDDALLSEHLAQLHDLVGTGYADADLDALRATLNALEQFPTEMAAVADVRPHPKNYRSHPDDQIDQLAASLREHGLYRNVVVARDGTILAGHGVVEAARRIGLDQIPVVRVDLDPSDPAALKILTGDNELGNLAEVDDRLLTEHLRALAEIDELPGTGFDSQRLAALVYVTRPASEIASMNEASHWVGMPEFEAASDDVLLVLHFDDEAGRDELVASLGVTLSKKTRQTWSSWWPPREKKDLSSLLFDDPVEANGAG